MRLISMWATGATRGASRAPMRRVPPFGNPSGQGVPAQGPPATTTRPAASPATGVKPLSRTSASPASRGAGSPPEGDVHRPASAQRLRDDVELPPNTFPVGHTATAAPA